MPPFAASLLSGVDRGSVDSGVYVWRPNEDTNVALCNASALWVGSTRYHHQSSGIPTAHSPFTYKLSQFHICICFPSCYMGTAINHPVPDWVKLSFVILTSGHSDAQDWPSECPDVKNYKWRHNPVWHRRCTHMAPVGIKGLISRLWSTVNALGRRLKCSKSLISLIFTAVERMKISLHICKQNVLLPVV